MLRQGTVHREIKYVNLLRTPRKQLKNLDFGLAKVSHRQAKGFTGEGSFRASKPASHVVEGGAPPASGVLQENSLRKPVSRGVLDRNRIPAAVLDAHSGFLSDGFESNFHLGALFGQKG